MDEIQTSAAEFATVISRCCKPLADMGLLQLPVIPENCDSNYHMFKVMTDSAETRNHLLAHLRSNGIGATFHYVPLWHVPDGAEVCRASGPAQH